MDVAVEQESPRVIKVRFAGRLDSARWRAVLSEVEKHLAPGHPSAILIDAQGFEGWEPGDWDDLSFQLKHDANISRIAIVGQPQWEDRVLMFAGKGLRPVDIRFFAPPEKQRAREWAAGGS